MSAPRLLVVVAHPDDETFGCGSLLLHAAARNAITTVCCATRGEAGEPAPGSHLLPGQLGEVREQELRAAADVLGVHGVELLGFRDSGMTGPAPAGALESAPFQEVAAAVRDVIDQTRPHVVVTLDGSDGHRDHGCIRDATVTAVEEAAWRVQRVALHCIPRSLLRRWAEHVRTDRPDSPYVDVDAAGLGTPDECITTAFDVAEHLEDRRRAIACHASQASPFAGLPEQLERDFLTVDHVQLVRPPTDSAAPLDDLFDGITVND